MIAGALLHMFAEQGISRKLLVSVKPSPVDSYLNFWWRYIGSFLQISVFNCAVHSRWQK